jgi:PKD repeat protein
MGAKKDIRKETKTAKKGAKPKSDDNDKSIEEEKKDQKKDVKSKKGGETDKKIFMVVIVISIIIAASVLSAFLYFREEPENGDENGNGKTINEAPIADAGGNQDVYTLIPLTFNGANSYDPDGSIVNYNWSFGDGTFSSEKSPIHNYRKPGLFLVRLSVEDDEGLITSDTAYIRVFNRAPIIAAQAPSKLTVFQAAQFNGTATDEDGFITLYEWDFDGDGIFDWYAKTTGKTNYVFSKVGTYTVRFKVTDDNGETNITEFSVVVEPIPNNAPVANGGTDQMMGTGTVTFFGTGTDPEGNIVNYQWDFDGDGTFDWNSTENGIVNHTFNLEGLYSAVFRVTDEFGLQDSDVVNITIDNKIITERIGATIFISWNESHDESANFSYIISFNNTIDPSNLTIYIKSLPQGDIEKLLYPADVVFINNKTVIAQSSIAPESGNRLAVEVFYLDYLVGQRELSLFDDFQRRLLNPELNQTAEYSYSTDLRIEQSDVIREENHTGILNMIQNNRLLLNNYFGNGNLKLTQDLEGSRAIFNLTSSRIYRNETWQDGILKQESFDFKGTGRYKLISSQGASFDINLDRFILKEQNGNRTDYSFHGKGTYSNPPIDGTIEIEYILLGLEEHKNWEGILFDCEQYMIKTKIEYDIDTTRVKLENTSWIWVIAEKGSYKETTIYIEYVYFYIVNDTVLEQGSGQHFPPGAPEEISAEQSILEAIELAGVVPAEFNAGDTITLSSSADLKVRYAGTFSEKQDIFGESVSVTSISGEVILNGEGISTLRVVNSGKQKGWIISRHEQFNWNDDRYERRLDLIED